MNINKKKFLVSLSLFSFLILPVFNVEAATTIKTLNGLSATDQTFTNDANIVVNSSGSVHTIGWNGVLSALRGGLGVNASTFGIGSIPFFNGSVFGSFGTWDGTKFTVGGDIDLDTHHLTVTDIRSPIFGSQPLISLNDTKLYDPNGVLALDWHNRVLYNESQGAVASYSVVQGNYFSVKTAGGVTPFWASFDNIGFSADRVFTFPDASGTFPLLEVENTFSNSVNKFISNTNSTVHIGADGFPGCIVMGDDDSSGVTYITVNDGVISVSTTQPSNCN